MPPAPLPRVRLAIDEKRCWNCMGWAIDDHLKDIGDCKLGPDPRTHFRRGVVPRMTSPDQVCDRFDSSLDVLQEDQRVRGI